MEFYIVDLKLKSLVISFIIDSGVTETSISRNLEEQFLKQKLDLLDMILKSKSDLLYSVLESTSLFENNSYIERINFKTPKDFFTKFQNKSLKFTKKFNITDLEKINEFKLDKIEIDDFLKNRNLYMLTEPYSKKP